MVKYGMQARALAEQATRYVLARVFRVTVTGDSMLKLTASCKNY